MRSVMLIMLLGFWNWQAVANTLYKCTDDAGVVLYTLAPSPKKSCSVLSQQTSEPTTTPSAKTKDPRPTNVQRAPKPRTSKGSGTGFAISNNKLLTNHHVVSQCDRIRIMPRGAIGKVVASDRSTDLAIVESTDRYVTVANFRTTSEPRLGEEVTVAGYPLPGILDQSLNITRGVVSSKAGLRGDQLRFQISAPIQPGNSGGPVLDKFGNVIGVVVASLNSLAVAQVTGSFSQNVNFAIRETTAIEFLKRSGVQFKSDPKTVPVDSEAIGTTAEKFTVLLNCYND